MQSTRKIFTDKSAVSKANHFAALHILPYDYTVKVRNRFKGLDLIDRVPEELWTEVCNIV